jgi:membrane fusion protein, heavy metal efflux system
MNMKRKQMITVVAIVIFGATAAAFILATNRAKPAGDDHGHGAGQAHAEHGAADAHTAGETKKGPRGGKLFVDGDFGLEVTIFETGMEPEFRIYTYLKGKPVDPASTTATITLERLGRDPQQIQFAKVADYLKGNAVIEEPHSFEVTVAAQRDGKTHRFAYAQEEARVEMSDAQAKEAGIEIKSAGPAKIKSSLRLIGDIKLNGDRTVLIVPRLAGVVESANANAGDVVKKGQVLGVIFSPALADQRGQLLAAQKRLALAQTTYEREKKLFEGKISAEQDFLQARAAMNEAEITVRGAQQKLSSIGGLSSGGGNLTRYEIRAPISGTIVEKNLSVGQAIKEDANIFTLADLTSVWAEMTVYAKDMNVIRVGQKVTLKSAEFDSSAEGVVSYVGALAGEQTRTAKARVVLANPNSAWRPGLPVNVEVESAESEVPVAVSADAIQTLRDWSVVFGRYDNAFEARPLKLGRSDGKMVEVLKGLSAGEKYAAHNSYVIKADIGKAGASHDH